MVDVIYGDSFKKVLRFANVFIDDNYDVVDSDKEYFTYISKIVDEAAYHIETVYHRTMMLEYTAKAFWLIDKKHLYNDGIIYLLYLFGNDDIKRMVKDKVVEPEFWKKSILDYGIQRIVIYMMKKFHENTMLNPTVTHDDVIHAGNCCVRFMAKELNRVWNRKRFPYVCELIEFFLWIAYKDTAYRDIFFYLMDKLGNDEIRAMVAPYVKRPEMWSMNAWQQSIRSTKELQDDKQIPKGQLSYSEQINVPSIQRKRLSNIIKSEVVR